MLFFLFNPLIVYYSQEARMYMMTVFFLSLAFYFFLKRDFLLFNFFNILSFYSFYGSIFIIAGFFLLLFLKKTYRSLLFSAFLFAIALLCISPLLYSQFTHSRQALIYVNNWNLVLGKASIKNLLLIPLKFSSGRISFYPKILYYIVTGIWALIVWTFVSRGAIKNMGIRILLFLPLVLGFLFSFISPLLQYFRFLYLIVPMSLLLGIETVKKWQRFILLAGMTIFSLIYLIMPQFHREDWKTAAESLIDYHSVYMILDSSDPIRYYAPALFIKELRTLEGIDIEKEVVVIPYTADIYGFDYKKELMKHRFTYKETRHFRGVWYEIWSKNKIYAGSFLYSFTEA